jgi:hypothetical protein
MAAGWQDWELGAGKEEDNKRSSKNNKKRKRSFRK